MGIVVFGIPIGLELLLVSLIATSSE